MKMKKLISLFIILCVAATMLTACAKFPGKKPLSVSFPKTALVTDQETETVTNYSHDKVIVHEDGYIEVRGTVQSGAETYSVQWLYAPDGKPVGSRPARRIRCFYWTIILTSYREKTAS